MKITINPEMRRELNKIAGMLNSPDPESVKLGAQLSMTSDTVREFRSMWYSSREGREIPISWYIKKAHKIIEEQTQKKNRRSMGISKFVVTNYSINCKWRA